MSARPTRLGWALLCVAAALAGCAPHRGPSPEPPAAELRARYMARVSARRAAAAGADVDLALWAETEDTGRLPAVEGRLALVAPDVARLRVTALFGTVLDIGARGDTLAAYVPPRRVGLELDSVEDSLGLAGPGTLAFRAWSALWEPPDSAWVGVTRADSVRVVRWREGRDSLALALGADATPVWAEAWRGDGAPWRARYGAWTAVDGVAWPALVEFADRAERFRLTARVEHAHLIAMPERARAVVRVPADAQRWTLADLRDVLARLGAP